MFVKGYLIPEGACIHIYMKPYTTDNKTRDVIEFS